MANKKRVAYGNAFFRYTNDIGRSKTLAVYGSHKQGDKYAISLWDNETGADCGRGFKTKKEIIEFLAHYGVNADLSDLEMEY